MVSGPGCRTSQVVGKAGTSDIDKHGAESAGTEWWVHAHPLRHTAALDVVPLSVQDA